MRFLKNDVGALFKQLVNHPRDCFLISRYRAGRKDYRVALSDRNPLVHPVCHTAQCRHTFALTSRRNNNGLVARIIFQPFNINQRVVGNADTV